ncbi:MAG: RibD family protein, partial [bacterium]
QMDVVMVGAGTIIADDPRLTCRLAGGRDPLRVVVDGRLRVPLAARVLTKTAARGTVLATVNANQRKLNAYRARGAEVLTLPGRDGRLSLRRLLRQLAARGVNTVLLEGGATLAAAALREGVVDRIALFLAPKLVGGDGIPMLASLGVRTMAGAPALRISGIEAVGVDWLVRAEPEFRGV